MAKTTKKKNRKLRRQIRKTVGALFMASAVAVAAIPVQDVRGADENPQTTQLADKVWVWDEDIASSKPASSVAGFCESKIPEVAAGSTIYSSGNGKFQFAYVDPPSGGSKVAVILNYVPDNLPNATLEIPNSMEAYRKYRATSTDGYYCLVTKNDEFMFYDVYEQDTANVNGTEQKLYWVDNLKYREIGKGENGRYPETDDPELLDTPYVVNYLQLSADGKYHRANPNAGEGEPTEDVYEVSARMVTHQKPCYYEQRDVDGGWGTKDDTELYYQKKGSVTADKPDGDLEHPADETHYRIDAKVAYIGKQFIDSVEENGIVTGWEVRTDNGNLCYRTNPEDGVFAGSRGGNIANLIIGESLSGISDYAFYGTSINSITFGNNLTTIGNGAFMDCIMLKSVTMPTENNLTALGKETFKGCTALPDFKLPISVRVIGDSCFEGCTALQHVELGGGSSDPNDPPQTTWLQTIGNYAFKNCSNLSSLFLPSQYQEKDLQIAVFEGCKKLQVVRVPNSSANFIDTDSPYTFENFKNDVPKSFYFWGADTNSDDRTQRSELHKTANEEEIAYKYWDRELYEIVKSEESGDTKITYQVNDSNELKKIWLEGTPVNVEIPSEIGPYGISTIAKGCFNDACTIEKVIIPPSVTKIDDEAFKGSHNLKTIIFVDSTTIKEIGEDAFRTQATSCKHPISDKEPELTIVGAMIDKDGNDTVPFDYAMKKEHRIDDGNEQIESWITCHSGWPTNLEVKYNYDFTTNQGGSELQGYPRYSNFLKEDASGAIVPDEDKIKAYVEKLPYVNTSDTTKEADLVKIIKEAIEKYEKNDPTDPPTGTQQQIVNASKNIVVPTNVDRVKAGIFSGYTYKTDDDGNVLPEKITLGEPDTYLSSVVLYGVDTVEPFTFTGCKNLKNATVIGANEIGDYAFGALENEDPLTGKMNVEQACESLTNVTLGPQITTTGLRPFRGCTNLTNIECLGNNLSSPENSGLLFNHTDGGKVLVECLPGRGKTVGSVTVRADELAGVTALQDEAFMDCNNIRNVDLTDSQVEKISRSAFENADQLSSVLISNTVGSIEKDAFVNDPMLNEITVPSSVTYIENGAFISKPDQQKIEFTCKEGSAAYRYATSKLNRDYISVNTNIDEWYWAQFIDYPDYPDTSKKEPFGEPVKTKVGEAAVTPVENPSPRNGYVFAGWLNNGSNDRANVTIEILPQFSPSAHTVRFVDGCPKDSIGTIEEQIVENGKNPKYPDAPEHEGYVFEGWVPDLGTDGVTDDITIIASYSSNTSGENSHKVTYYDWEGKIYTTQTVGHGDAASPIAAPTRTGYTFVRWVSNGDLTKVESDLIATPMYEPNGNNSGSGGSGSGSGSGGSGSGNGSDDKKNSSASPSASPTASPSVTKYTVSVSGGSGSGSYAAGDIVAVNAYFMGEGQNFDKWTTSTAGVGFANPNASSTTFTMPAANVAVTATYKTGSGTTTTGGGSTAGGGGSGVAPANTNSGTTVQVSKPGISNTGLAGATVSGATDNFIVKVTEQQSATDAAVAALQARYGSLDRIKYFPMDISLYDSTGRTKIADTSGISVNITLPLPDDQVQYAGNNRIAAVANGSLEDLNAKFTTVDGVPCINFTASHFSPYVIYVDTANLTAGTIDSTPKTGDPIHPKWFLAIGMACISLILFFKKDKVVVRPGRA